MVHVTMIAKVFKDAFAIYCMPVREFIDEEVVEVMHMEPYGNKYHKHPQGEQRPCVLKERQSHNLFCFFKYIFHFSSFL